MGYGGWMGVGILPLLWGHTNNNMIRATMAILAPTTCSLVMTSFFVAFYMLASLIWTVGGVMANPVFLLSSMGSVCIATISVAMYFALPLYMQGKTIVEEVEPSDNESEGSEEESQGSETSEEEDNRTVSDAESTDIEPVEPTAEPDNTWREQANFEGLRNAPELTA